MEADHLKKHAQYQSRQEREKKKEEKKRSDVAIYNCRTSNPQHGKRGEHKTDAMNEQTDSHTNHCGTAPLRAQTTLISRLKVHFYSATVCNLLLLVIITSVPCHLIMIY